MRLLSRSAWGLATALGAGSAGIAAQTAPGLVLRLDLAALDPSNAQGIHLAWSAGAGLAASQHSYFLVDLTRQNLSEEVGGGSSFWQTFVGGAWEYGFGSAVTGRRQAMTLLRSGLLIRPAPLANAAYLGVGVGLRYPVASWIHFQARIEDDLDFPRAQTLSSCVAPGDCSPVRVGGKVEQNLGLFLGAEVHP